MNKTLDDEVYVIDGCAIEADFAYIVTGLERYDPREYAHSRLSVYDGQSPNKWHYHDSNSNIVSVCIKKKTPTEGRKLCSLSKEGEVELYSNKDGSITREKIPEAGLRLGTRGYLTNLREIGQSLYACGANDQVYCRADGAWHSLTVGPLSFRSALDPDYSIFSTIDGSSETDIYVCGLKGRLFHYDGTSWKQVELSVDEHLNCVRCVSADEVWICGKNGCLLKGNVRDGFRDVSSVDDNDTFVSLAKFQGQVFVSGLETLYVYAGNRIAPVQTGLTPEVQSYYVDAGLGCLWSFGVKDIAVFDGNTWTRIDHPDNPPIR